MAPEEIEEESPEEQTDEEVEEVEDVDDDAGQEGCQNSRCEHIGEEDMLVTKDLNLDYPWKDGNKYCRICPNCNRRVFCAASYWESKRSNDETVAYVIEQGDDTPRPIHDCPWDDDYVDDDPCGDEFHGTPVGEEPPSECPNCERELIWE